MIKTSLARFAMALLVCSTLSLLSAFVITLPDGSRYYASLSFLLAGIAVFLLRATANPPPFFVLSMLVGGGFLIGFGIVSLFVIS